jgi:ring-1,2-phenylacetyl-CoA epoxidase subunit PaaB
MTDTQWPLFEVFEQERSGQPHRNAGAVHAPDAELALQNARDVFVRRPDCASLWVVPAGAIFSRTAEELADEPANASAPEASETEGYEVFQKQSQRQSEVYVIHLGQVEAHSPTDALRQARLAFAETPGFVWWLVPTNAITRSDDADADSWFEPAREKTYRHPSDYPVLTQMRAVKSSASAGDPLEDA